MILERTGDARWYLKDTDVFGDTDVWLKLIEEASGEYDESFCQGA